MIDSALDRLSAIVSCCFSCICVIFHFGPAVRMHIILLLLRLLVLELASSVLVFAVGLVLT